MAFYLSVLLISVGYMPLRITKHNLAWIFVVLQPTAWCKFWFLVPLVWSCILWSRYVAKFMTINDKNILWVISDASKHFGRQNLLGSANIFQINFLNCAPSKLRDILLSLCPSVLPSVNQIVSALYLPQYWPDPFHIHTSYQPTSEGVSRVIYSSFFFQIWIFAAFFFHLMT